MQREDIKMLVEKWWEIYNDESLNFKKPQPPTDALLVEAAALQPLIVAAMNEATGHGVKYVAAPSAA